MMKSIILCADDYGQTAAISQAIIRLIKAQRLSATSCLTTSPLWPEHAKWLKELNHPVDIGLHFNLTEGKPLSQNMRAHVVEQGFLSLPRLLWKAYLRKLNFNDILAELNAQIDAFEAEMGCFPDYLDGHQHVHQLPIIRDAVLKVYEERLQDGSRRRARASSTIISTNQFPLGSAQHEESILGETTSKGNKQFYIRSVYDQKFYLGFKKDSYIKKCLIQLCGASAFKKQLLQRNIPHNSSFSGIYNFRNVKLYPKLFINFLKQIEDNGLIMCHPGLDNHNAEQDAIYYSRQGEYEFLMSDAFLEACISSGVILKNTQFMTIS